MNAILVGGLHVELRLSDIGASGEAIREAV
jgi:hypothetical protein